MVSKLYLNQDTEKNHKMNQELKECATLKDLELSSCISYQKNVGGDVIIALEYFHKKKILNTKEHFNQAKKGITRDNGWTLEPAKFQLEIVKHTFLMTVINY